MKININLLTIVFVIIFLQCKGQDLIDRTMMLEGKWKMENKENYEEWIKGDLVLLNGKSYKIRNKERVVLEELDIKIIEGKVLYTARVFDQNDGKSISFVLNEAVEDCLSFENEKHDFPKKIVYKKISSNTIFVEVLGEKNHGFSFNLIRQ